MAQGRPSATYPRGEFTSLRDFESYCRRIAKHHIQEIPRASTKLCRVCSREGFRQGLVTSRTAADTKRWLAMCELSSACFDVMITYSDRLPSKPHPGGLLAAADRLSSGPGKCVYIGDTIVDGIASNRAGMRFLLAGWGTPDTGAVLCEVGQVVVLEDPVDVLPWVHGGVP